MPHREHETKEDPKNATKNRPVLVQLYKMLSDKNYRDILKWSNHGTEILIEDEREFEQAWKDFTNNSKAGALKALYRTLHLYNFSLKRDPFHSNCVTLIQKEGYFVRGRPDLFPYIQRVRKV